MPAALCAVFLVVARRRFAELPTRWPSAIRLGVLGFFAVLAASCGVDVRVLSRDGQPETACVPHKNYKVNLRGALRRILSPQSDWFATRQDVQEGRVADPRTNAPGELCLVRPLHFFSSNISQAQF